MSTRQPDSGKKIFRKTFTYFLPAPPLRKSGYREVEFDKMMKGFIETGFEVESLQSQSVSTGLFIICVLKTTLKKVYEKDIALDLHENFKLSHTHSSPDIILDEEEDV